jgi:hypothetical protein
LKLTTGLLFETTDYISRFIINPDTDINIAIDGVKPSERIIPLLEFCDYDIEKFIFSSTYKNLSPYKIYRDIIFKYIVKSKYPWLGGGWRGKDFIEDRLNKDLNNCLFQANLNQPSDDIAWQWWSELIFYCRNISKTNLEEIGNIGHQLSFDYEKNRTSSDPIRTYISNTKAGYDLTSILSQNSTDKILIEVKASVKPINIAYANVTYNEWKAASDRENYFFHLWLLDDPNNHKLAILEKDRVINEKPSNLGLGEWSEYRISFLQFQEDFKHTG